MKINCDGSYKPEFAGIGFVCRDERGAFMWGFGERVIAESAIVAEILAFRQALLLVEEVVADKIFIEVDCSEIYWCCKRKSVEGVDWRGKWEMQEAIVVLEGLRNVEVILVSRQGNMATDYIAVNCGKGVGPVRWVKSPPLPSANIIAHNIRNCEEAKTVNGSADFEEGTDVSFRCEDGRFDGCGIG